MSTRHLIPPGYSSVTEILSPYSKLHLIDKDVVARAADRGTRAHAFCTMYALDLLFCDVDTDCRGYVDAFKIWCDRYLDKVLLHNSRISSSKFRLSGELDLLVKLKSSDSIVLIDIKTPASSSPGWALQTAAYKMLAEQELEQRVDQRIILQLPKIGGIAKVIQYTEHKKDEQLFLNALELFRIFNP